MWRYYDATKFISILQNRGLYFNRADNYADSFEGIFPKERLEREYENALFNKKTTEMLVLEGILPEGLDDRTPKEGMFEIIQRLRRRSYLNCWHMNNSESMAMWQAYLTAGDGVLVKSTYSKLKSAVDIHNQHTYRMGKVDYLPWLDEDVEEELDERERNNWFYPFMYKQEEYEYEKEVRVVVDKGPLDSKDELKSGFFVKTDLNELIDSVIVSPNAPPWSDLEFWKDILRKYKLRANVERSTLEITPDEIIENIDQEEVERRVKQRLDEWRKKQDYLD